MISAPANWNTLWAAEGTVMELRLTIDSDVYYNDSLASGDCKLTHYLYDNYGVGNACFGKLNVTVFGPSPIAAGPRECQLACRLVSADGQTSTAWVPQGTWYVNKAVFDEDSDLVKLELFDGLALCDMDLFDGGKAPSSVTFPLTGAEMVQRICTRTGIGYPDTDTGFASVSCPDVDRITCREALGYIAALAGGNFTMRKDGKLAFVPLAHMPSASSSATLTAADLERTGTMKTVTGLELSGDGQRFEEGNAGFVLKADCEYATETSATAAYYKVRGNQYQGFRATGVYASPLLELGDAVTVGTQKFLADSVSLVYEQGMWGSVESPLRDEVEQRIKYSNDSERKINRLSAKEKKNSDQLDTMETDQYVSELIGRINDQANATGGYTYITEGQGIRTYDRAVSDPLVGSEASAVVEVKGGTVRIANSKTAQGQWEWLTVFTSGHIAAELVTAVNIVAGFIGSPSGNYWNLDTGVLHATVGHIGGFTIGDTALYNNMTELRDTAHRGVWIGTDGISSSNGAEAIAFSGGGIQGFNGNSQSGYITPTATATGVDQQGHETTLHGLQMRGEIIDIRTPVLTVKADNNTSGASTVAYNGDVTYHEVGFRNATTKGVQLQPWTTVDTFVNGILTGYTYTSPTAYRFAREDWVQSEINDIITAVNNLQQQITNLSNAMPQFTLSGDTLFISG
jgi:hypothetical protein